MSFNFFCNISQEPKNMTKILIIYHVFELFEKSYKNLIKNNSIIQYPADIQMELTALFNWWVKRKLKSCKNIDPDKDFAALLKIIELWAYLQ